MAEQFLEEIYEKAMLIEQVREYIDHTLSGCERDARAAYNRFAKTLERILPEIRAEQPARAEGLLRAAVEIRDCFADPYKANAAAESRLLPELFSLMRNYTGINVTEGRYRLQSAASGFLGLYDLEHERTIHSLYDPLWEAYRTALTLYDPSVECYHILGVGLGYLPYQLWRISEGAIRLVIYEEDEQILNYAKAYGVLEWIAGDALEIVYYENPEELARWFINGAEHLRPEERYISPWKKEIYRTTYGGDIAVLEANDGLERSMKKRTAVNLWKNRKHKSITLEELRKMLCFDEWIMVSAGPSLDENLEFLKESRGKKKIVAVNTVLRRLFREGIRPDLVVAADQYVQMREHIDGIGEQTDGIPMIAEKRLNWQYAEQYQGPICFISTYESGEKEHNTEELWEFSGSVAGLALEAAVHLGAKKVWLVGQDLAYPDGKTYAEGMPYNADASSRATRLVASVDGGRVPTSEAFHWFRLGLEAQIENYPETVFYNLSKHGALINGCRKGDGNERE